MRVATLGLLLAGCGPVLLLDGSAGDARDAGQIPTESQSAGAAGPQVAAEGTAQDGGIPPSVSVSVKPVDCGKCFELQAAATGGQGPYTYAWDNGLLGAERYVCVDRVDLTLTVVAHDAVGAASAAHTIGLAALGDAGCAEPMQPTAASPRALLCLDNPSFEGTPAANLGQTGAFDAPPWSTCTNLAMPSDTPNMPAIADEAIAQGVVPPPKAIDGTTFLALSEGAQVSQAVCSPIDSTASYSVELDISRVDATAGLVPQTERAFLEIWGGVAVDCSQRELLWASPALSLGWTHYCVTFHPHSFMNQITLRGQSDMSQPSSAYFLVDNLRPVESCP